METGERVHGRARASRPAFVHALTPLVAILALLLIAALGCGAERGGKKSAAAKQSGGSKPASGAQAKTAAAGGERTTDRETSKPSGRSGVVQLLDKGCIEFEPRWVTIHTGQSITWRSDLKKSVTVIVSAGAFSKTQYTVRPGQSVTTGPALAAGSFAIWTEPAACQGVARGPQGTGPGVKVEGD